MNPTQQQKVTVNRKRVAIKLHLSPKDEDRLPKFQHAMLKKHITDADDFFHVVCHVAIKKIICPWDKCYVNSHLKIETEAYL